MAYKYGTYSHLQLSPDAAFRSTPVRDPEGTSTPNTVMTTTTLDVLHVDNGWQYKERDASVASVLDEANASSGWTSVAAFPSEIYSELIKAGTIPDPYYGKSDSETQWVDEADWLYKTNIKFHKKEGHTHVDLHFDGLDTYCTVYLNGKVTLQAEDMYLPYVVRLDPKDVLEDNVLLLHFRPAKLVAFELEQKYGRVRAGSCNVGDASRAYSRKAQYHWRWDWGPELMCVGPWRPIYFRSYTAAIDSVLVSADVDSNLSMSLNAAATFVGSSSAAHSITATLVDAKGKEIRKESRPLSTSETKILEAGVSWDFKDGETELWWPINYGVQTLYNFEIKLLDKDDKILDSQSKRVGFRRVRLIQEPLKDAPGTTFLFQINNVRIFMGGSNWVPCHTLLTEIKDEDYVKWLQTMVDGNQNMVRIWSGGVYEPQVFYDTCDELGILVWQDFIGFACGMYPAHEEYVKLVTEEAEANVKLLRHHPSIVIWCGNNEDYQQILQWNESHELPARKFYEEVFPDIVNRLSPGVPYWFGSPYGGAEWYETADLTVGDVHEWHIWCNSPTGEYYQNYEVLGGRFVSEFGLPSFPNKPTLDRWLEGVDELQKHPQSPIMAFHNRAGSFERRFAVYMNENFRMTGDLESYAFLTQIMQAEGLGYAYRSWRRDWRGEGKQYTAGALTWQLDDSWPVTSWAIIDFYFFKKPSFYVTARELQPVVVGLTRKVKKNRDNDRPRMFYEFGAFQNESAKIEAWVSNFTLKTVDAKVELSYYDLSTNKVYHNATLDIKLLPNQSTDIFDETITPPPKPASTSQSRAVELDRTHTVIVHARVVDPSSGTVLARASNWPEPFKYTTPPNPELKATLDGETLKVEVTKPAKTVFFSVEGQKDGNEVKWADNAIDLFPGDPQNIKVTGINGRKVLVQYLGHEKAAPVA